MASARASSSPAAEIGVRLLVDSASMWCVMRLRVLHAHVVGCVKLHETGQKMDDIALSTHSFSVRYKRLDVQIISGSTLPHDDQD
jgi:hypothetical protein